MIALTREKSGGDAGSFCGIETGAAEPATPKFFLAVACLFTIAPVPWGSTGYR